LPISGAASRAWEREKRVKREEEKRKRGIGERKEGGKGREEGREGKGKEDEKGEEGEFASLALGGIDAPVSDSMTDITAVTTANLGFWTTASSQKVLTSDYNIERQPEIAIWPPKPGIVTQLELQQIASTFCTIECVTALHGHPRSLILAPIY